MKRRLLAFLLAFVMTFSLVPVNTFAAEADAAVHYTNITTESGENVTVEYVETVVGEAAWGQSINTPYYHVTIPEGTEKVLLTYPESVNLVLSGDDGAVFFYRNTYPGQSTIDLGGALTVATNDDGSKTVTIPVENFMLSAAGSVAVGMAYYVDEENRSAAEFFDFTYAALTHAVTLTSGEGYTLTGEATVEDGKDYSFTVTIADDYEMEDNFVVKANGETLTAGESGSYTVENVTADLTITVEGVVKKQAASHSVTLTSGGGYTLKGETTVADGADYTFSLKFDNYYGAGNGFAVKANGTALTAGEDGTYTVKNVTADLTITVEGVARLYKVFLPHGWSRQFTMSACDGYADPSTDPKIAKGGDYKFKVTPNEGFAVRDNNYDVSFSGAGTVSVEVKDGYAVVTLTDIFSNGDVRIQGVKEIITVTLPKGEGFTAAAAEGTKTPVLKGDSYSFTVTVAEGYEKTDDFAVKANGEALTAGESGSYTVENVTADLTITVEGVTEAVQKTAGLSVLKFGDTSTEAKAQMFQLIPAFDPAVKEYTVLVPDNSNMFYAWATKADDRSSSTTITAKWVNLNVDTEKTQALTSGKASGQNLAGFAPTGTKVNTMTVTVVDGDFKDEYKLTSVRVAPSLTALSLDGIRFAERFSATKTAYTATTAAESVTVAATPRDESYTVTVNGGSDTTVPLNLGENKINVVVTNPGGYTNTYTITVTRLASIEVGFTVDPADAKVTVWDSNKDRIAPTDGKYSVMADAEYTYLVQSDGYVSQKSSFKFSESSTVDITLAVATENPNLDRSITAEWGNFRNGDNNLGITNAKTPYAPEDTELLWAVKHGTGWAAAPGSPIMVDGDIYTYSGSTIRRLNSMTGEVVTEGTMVDKSSYSIVPMTYGDGMVFVGLSGGKIQAFNAKTLESLWVYTDELGGQPNCPITYKDGYIYAGFWNSEDRNANFACINTVDEDHASTTEAKYASWTYTRQGGFYWAGAYVTDKLAIVGTDDGAGGYDTNGAALLVFDRYTGEKLDAHEGIRGDLRSNVSHDPQSDRVFFTTKGGILGNAQIDWDTGKILDYKEVVIKDAQGNANAMSTCTPSVYNGRIYIGVAGTSQFGANSGHGIAVYNLNGDGSMTQAYVYAIVGYPQTSAMVSTAYSAEDGSVYIYLPYNYTPGGVSVLKDKPGQTAPVTTTGSGYSEVFTPVGPLAQYCICSTIADQYGTIYYKNDSCYMMAITSKIESLEITQYPTITENEDGSITVDGLKAVTKLKNGEERDVSNYVSVVKNEETGGYTVSYTYGFDNANYGLKTVTAEIADYTVTIPTGEGYTITGEKTVKNGEDYTFTVTVTEGYDAANMVVKVNDTEVTAVDGKYTVEKVSSDLTITVSGVKKQVAGHAVTLTPGEGYTLTGEATAEDGKDYTFTVTVAEGFVKNGAFAVKADGTALKANEDGSYTVKAVAADLTITVEGVMTPPANGLSAFAVGDDSDSSTANKYEFTPSFDPAVKEYTVGVPDSNKFIYAWAIRDSGLSSEAVIKAAYTSVTNSKKTTKVITSNSATGVRLTGATVADAVGNTVTITVTDGDYSDSYTVNIVRTDPTLTSLSLGNVKLDKTFASAEKAYTATTAEESVTVAAVPKSEGYTVTVNGGTDNVVALAMGENVIEIVVQNARGDKNTYTITVTRVKAARVSFNVTPADAEILLTDSKKNAVTPDSNGVYHLTADSTYTYLVKKVGYIRQGETFTATEDKTFTIQMKEAPHEPVTVYFSFSHDDTFESCEQSGQTVALKKVTVPYFDLALYGLEDFYFASEDYGPASGDPTGGPGSALDPGTQEFAYGKITMLHLFLYATEVYYLGIDPADAGKGYLADNGIMGTDIFSYTGSTGSIFLQNIWKYDLNLNYYLNYEYPLASAGWGSTCDQILLREGDIVTLGHFSDWSFFNDTTSIFNYIVADKTDPVQGDKIKLELYHAGADMYGTYNTAHTLIDYSPSVYCTPVNDIVSGDVTTWQYVGNAEADGSLVVDTSTLAPGEYIFALAGQPGKENPGAICSTPGGIRLTIHEKPVVKGDINGDGVIDSTDVMALFNAINSGDDLDATVADVNGDGVIDARDVMALYNIIKSDN